MHEHDNDEQWISKSQRKRDSHALQDLGSELVKLPVADLDKLPLEEDLRQAILEAKRIKQHGALKRQLQFIGKLMRNSDADVIREAYQRLINPFREDIRHFHLLEQWRDRLLRDGDDALQELLQDYPDIDRQHIRQLIRTANKERKANKTPRAARELFQYLKTLMTS
jgi:ribosome-associated protein